MCLCNLNLTNYATIFNESPFHGTNFVCCTSGASSCLQSQIESDSSNQKKPSSSSSVFHAWQLCGDIHCLSTKLSESFSANLEDFQFENPEDAPVIKVARIINETGSGESTMDCMSLLTYFLHYCWGVWLNSMIFIYYK